MYLIRSRSYLTLILLFIIILLLQTSSYRKVVKELMFARRTFSKQNHSVFIKLTNSEY